MMVKWLIVVLLFLLAPSVFALGITPAIKTITYLPGQSTSIQFTVLDASPDKFYDVGFRGGDFVQYSNLSSLAVRGGESFLMTISFPEELPEPGKHVVSVSIKERPSEEAFIATVVEVGSVVDFFVPYPQVFGELTLSVPDSNAGDQVPVELHVINRGIYDLVISSVDVDFFDESKSLVATLNFTPVTISYAGDRYFRRYLDASDILPGNYLAVGRVNYNDVVKSVNSTFRLGNLFIDVTNYTRELPSKGIHKFIITIASNWNAPLSNVFADVSLFRGAEPPYNFRMPSTDLLPWQATSVESYLDTTNLLGLYNVSILLTYPGNSSWFYGNLLITEPSIYSSLAFILAVSIAGTLIFVGVIVWIIFRRSKLSR